MVKLLPFVPKEWPLFQRSGGVTGKKFGTWCVTKSKAFTTWETKENFWPGTPTFKQGQFKAKCLQIIHLAEKPRISINSFFVGQNKIFFRMRAVLLDWFIEVCEFYKLQRETFYLAVDYTDRFLGSTSNVPKSRLQLVGKFSVFSHSWIVTYF